MGSCSPWPIFFFSSRRRHTRWPRDWSSDVCSSDLGYITGFAVNDDGARPGRQLTITLKYTPDRQRTISGVRRISKPGLRVYSKATDVPRVLGGMGISILSTNQGLMTD